MVEPHFAFCRRREGTRWDDATGNVTSICRMSHRWVACLVNAETDQLIKLLHHQVRPPPRTQLLTFALLSENCTSWDGALCTRPAARRLM